MNELILPIVVAIFASTGFWSFLSNKIAKKKKKKTPIEKMVLALGRDKLLEANKRYRKKGFIPEDDYEAYMGLGEAYEAMGGNSLMRKVFEENRQLPVKEDIEE